MTKILVDAGLPARHIETALASVEADPDDLDAILVTHEHSDHVKGIGPLARRYDIPVYVNQRTWEALQPGIGNTSKMTVDVFKTGSAFTLGDVEVLPFKTPHDSVESVGFRIDTGRGVISICTDLGEMDETVFEGIRGSDIVYLEANYDEHMLLSGSYPWRLKQRIKGERGHLSNEISASAACRLVGSGTTRIVLSHLSRENNFPELAELTVTQGLRQWGVEVGGDLELSVAPRHCPGRIYRYAG